MTEKKFFLSCQKGNPERKKNQNKYILKFLALFSNNLNVEKSSKIAKKMKKNLPKYYTFLVEI